LPTIRTAHDLAQRGAPGEAAQLLSEAAKGGDAEAALELAFWNLQARYVPRNLPRSREYFRIAAELGNSEARSIYIALLGNGTAGASDFAGAVELLREFARDDAQAKRQLEIIAQMELDEFGNSLSIPQGTQISDSPSVWTFPSLFTPAECNYLKHAAEPAYQPAVVGHLSTGQQARSQVRTCDVAVFPWVAENPAIHALNRRIAAASETGVECGEPIQVLRYRGGQEFKPHNDFTADRSNQRILTMLVYLTDDYGGGETAFAANGLKVKGAVGDGLLFRNADDQGNPDPSSLHAGLPVSSGEKIVASRWIRQSRYGPAPQ
jgi:prolyl 4-hydroxylase